MIFVNCIDKNDNVSDFYTKFYDVYVKDCQILNIEILKEDLWEKEKIISTQHFNTWKIYSDDICVNIEDINSFVYDNLQFRKYGHHQYFINKKCKDRLLELIEDTKISLPYEQQIEYYYRNRLLEKQREMIVRLHGGLGNRLFQIASTYGLSKKYDYSFSVYISSNPHTHYTYDWILKKLTVESIDKNPGYEKVVEDSNDCLTVCKDLVSKIENNKYSKLHIFGYLQSELYFKDYIEDIVQIFKEPLSVKQYIEKTYQLIQSNSFIHVRLGDIINHSKHWVDCRNYYEKTIETDRHYFLFSDQPTKVHQYYPNIVDLSNVTIIDEDEINTLYLMKYCGLGGIAPNSTFSWWGLFLNMHKKSSKIPHYYMPSIILNNHDGKNDHYADGFTVIDV
tara:strand:+ start:146 stop:1324 length:1179 start_codon:yes stop_codon:yes gene_type:complete